MAGIEITKPPPEEISDSDSGEHVENQFQKYEDAHHDPRRIAKEYTIKPKTSRKRPISKIASPTKALSARTPPPLMVKGTQVVGRSISCMRSTRTVQTKQTMNQPLATLTANWASAKKSQVAPVQHEHTILDYLENQKPRLFMTRNEIMATAREIGAIEMRRRKRLMDQRTPDWAKGALGLTNSETTHKKVKVVSKHMIANDY